jgi:hypothetical protein
MASRSSSRRRESPLDRDRGLLERRQQDVALGEVVGRDVDGAHQPPQALAARGVDVDVDHVEAAGVLLERRPRGRVAAQRPAEDDAVDPAVAHEQRPPPRGAGELALQRLEHARAEALEGLAAEEARARGARAREGVRQLCQRAVEGPPGVDLRQPRIDRERQLATLEHQRGGLERAPQPRAQREVDAHVGEQRAHLLGLAPAARRERRLARIGCGRAAGQQVGGLAVAQQVDAAPHAAVDGVVHEEALQKVRPAPSK